MRFSIGFTFFLVTIAFVQSKPVSINANDLQDFLDQYPQFAGLVNQGAELASQALPLFSEAQLESLQNLVQNLADQVLSGKLDVNTAANRLLSQLQKYLGSNPQLFNDIQKFVQQIVNMAQQIGMTRAAFPSPADLSNLINQFKPNDLQAILAQHPQYAALINQITSLASQVVPNLSQSQLQSLGTFVFNLAQQVMSGQLDANIAASQLLGELQQYFGSNTQLFNSIANIVQQLVNLGGSGLARPALSRQFQINDLHAIVAQYPEFANLVGPLTAIAQQAMTAFSPAQLQSLQTLVLNLAQQVIGGQLDANVAAGQLLAQIQQYIGSNTQLYNDIASAVQQLVNLGQGY